MLNRETLPAQFIGANFVESGASTRPMSGQLVLMALSTMMDSHLERVPPTDSLGLNAGFSTSILGRPWSLEQAGIALVSSGKNGPDAKGLGRN